MMTMNKLMTYLLEEQQRTDVLYPQILAGAWPRPVLKLVEKENAIKAVVSSYSRETVSSLATCCIYLLKKTSQSSSLEP